MRAKVKILKIKTGSFNVFISPRDAEEWKLHPNDLVKIESGKRSIYASVAIGDFIEDGEVGLSQDILSSYQFSEGEVVSITPSGTPESVKYIKRR